MASKRFRENRFKRENEIIINYTPRYPEIHEAINKHRFSVLVFHRRAGKTVLSINELIRAALLCQKPFGMFNYIAPFRTQAKAIAWEYVKHYTAPLPRTINESELSITLPSGNGTSKIRLWGADNPDALRGIYHDLAVIDEVSNLRPETWEEVIRPALADRDGRAIFIGTPQGPNLFKTLFDYASSNKDPDWFAANYPVYKTSVIAPEEIERIHDEMGPDAYGREFLCDFNVAGAQTLIPLALVNEAMDRNLPEFAYEDAPVIMGVDIARYGDDSTVVCIRRGLFVEPLISWKGISLMETAAEIAGLIDGRHPAAVFIDGIGIGAGVVDRLRDLGYFIQEVNVSQRAGSASQYVNKRAEIYCNVKEWLKEGQLPQDKLLAEELAAIEYEFTATGKMMLVRKEETKEKLKRSPDRGDALAHTFFAAPIAMPEYWEQGKRMAYMEYDPLALEGNV